MQSKAWPYEEARKLLKRWPDGKPDGAPVIFETGYGPSGLPHIGTFNEVARTTFVRRAYEELTGNPTRLIAFSDDMDGLRKVPDNVPEQEMLAAHLGKPLTRIPDPFGSHESFAHHNNAMLRHFLDRFGFDYEMSGKDLIDSVTQSSKIARVLGGRPPEGFNYEMFLDEKGEKISKSKGNGLSLEEWLRYGSEPSLAFYIYREPRKAKSLHLGLIPRAVDEYWQFRGNYPNQPIEQKLGNPVHHIHNGTVPVPDSLPLTFGLLLNLVSLPGIHDKETAWRFVQRYAPDTSPENNAELDELIGLALNYARDFVVPTLERRTPNDIETAALRDLDTELAKLPADANGEAIQNIVFEVGKRHPFESLRGWFQALYETLLGSSQGPRMGSFIALYGIENSRRLIAEALA